MTEGTEGTLVLFSVVNLLKDLSVTKSLQKKGKFKSLTFIHFNPQNYHEWKTRYVKQSGIISNIYYSAGQAPGKMQPTCNEENEKNEASRPPAS